jgi:hypothetical protein
MEKIELFFNKNAKKIESFLVGYVVISFILKLFHIPYSATILANAFCGLAIWYILPIYRTKKNILEILNGFALSITIIGMLFRIMHWIFGLQELLIGLIGILIVSIFYIKNAKQNQTALIRNGVVGLFGLLIYLFW